MRKQTRHRFVATNYNRDERHLPFLLYNFYFMRFAQQRKGKLAKTKIFLSLTSGVCFFALIFENYHTIPLAQNEIHLQQVLQSLWVHLPTAHTQAAAVGLPILRHTPRKRCQCSYQYMPYGINSNGLPCVKILSRMGHHAVTERRKTGSASGLVEVESHDFNRGSVSNIRATINLVYKG